jgi:very-short-patch-repair endonuclease
MDRERLGRLARGQFGVFSRAQARQCGFSNYQIRRRLANGEWQLVLGAGLGLAGLKVTPMVRDRAAQLSVPGSVLGGFSAARTWQLPVPDGEPVLFVGPHGRSRLAGVRLVYERPARRDVYQFQGLPALTRPAAVVDCLVRLRRAEASMFADRALQAGWIGVDDLVRRIGSRVARRGVESLIDVMAGVVGGERSVAERRLTDLLRGARITGWEANAEIRDEAGLIGVGDVVFATAKLVVEVDGWAFHVTPERFQHDRQRQNWLVTAGWTVLRFTWRDLTERPDYVVASVRRLTQG